MKCPHCGKDVPGKLCPGCGKELPPKPPGIPAHVWVWIIGFVAFLIVALVVIVRDLRNPVIVGPQTVEVVDVVDIFELMQANPKAAAAKYGNRVFKLRGRVGQTIVTGLGPLVNLHHKRTGSGPWDIDDRIVVPFVVNPPHDQGFFIRFDAFGNVILPWRDGSSLEITGKVIFNEPMPPQKNRTISIHFPKLERAD